ncbi:MAG: S8 family serine peptidase [Ignavibacteria bacterium]|nr:S8 family serine peptidase [Ignavibacteria bacterium]
MKWRIALLFSCLLFMVAFAQTKEQKKWLMDFSTKQAEIAKAQKAEAEALARQQGMPIRQVLPDGKIRELIRIENGIPVYFETENMTSANTVSSSLVWSAAGLYNLDGKGITAGVWDGGPARATHREFGGRLTIVDVPTAASAQHATHVCGTISAAGIDPQAHGMADSVWVKSYEWTNDLSEITSAAANGLLVSNHSYGNLCGWSYNSTDQKWYWYGDITVSATEDYKFGYYSSTTSAWDNFLFNAPNILVCRSAGNDREETGPAAGVSYYVRINGVWTLSTDYREPDGGTDGYDCLKDVAVCKNVLSVGAVSGIYNGYQGPSSVIMSSFSSWGPVDDGRIKPDICADGVNLYSCDNSADNTYVTMSGTSMATPSATGSIAVLLQHQKNLYGNTPWRSSTMKGLLLHTADECGTAPGPDYRFGWGLLNTLSAAKLMDLNAQLATKPLIRELTLTSGQSMDIPIEVSGLEPLKATICWTDPAGPIPPVSLNPKDLELVNDLDIRVIGPTSTTYMPWVLDPAHPSVAATTGDNTRDNTEQVFIQTPAAGTYTIHISHKKTLTGGQQNFALILSGLKITAPDVTSLLGPATGSNGVSLTPALKWSKAAYADHYLLQIAKDTNFTNIVYQKDSISLINHTPTTLPGLSKLYWRVRSVNSGGNSAWSVINTFSTIIAPPDKPVHVSPVANAIVPTPVKFKWMKAANAATYRMQISTSVVMSTFVVNDSTITDTTYTTSALQDGKAYYWRMTSKNATATSGYTSQTKFITKLNTPDTLKGTITPAMKIKLTWKDHSANEQFFYILRKTGNGSYTQLDSVTANTVEYTDTNVVIGTKYYYKVYAMNSLCTSDTSAEVIVNLVGVNDGKLRPSVYSLDQNYPNPFNPTTRIKYSLPLSSSVKLEVFNTLGQRINVLVNTQQPAGVYEVDWKAGSLASGTYFYVLTVSSVDGTQSRTFTKKMLLVR